jgi:hypothetical protein
VNDFSKLGVLTWSANPSHFSGKVREIFQKIAGGGTFEVEEGLVNMPEPEFKASVKEKVKEAATGENTDGSSFFGSRKKSQTMTKISLNPLEVTLPMLGKTYSNGHEIDLNFALMKKPVKACMEESEIKYLILTVIR